jgi:hypothetical protein
MRKSFENIERKCEKHLKISKGNAKSFENVERKCEKHLKISKGNAKIL